MHITSAAALRPSMTFATRAQASGLSNFSLWRSVGVRGTGFPARWLEPVAAPESTAAAAALVRLVAQTRAAVREDVGGRLRALVQRRERSHPDFAALERASRVVSQTEPWGRALLRPEVMAISPVAKAAAGALQAAILRVERSFVAERTSAKAALRALAQNPRFQEALAWSNPQVWRTAVAPLLASPPGRDDSKTAQREQVVARYLQRFTTKNDTIGFFGPVCWGAVHDRPGFIEVTKATEPERRRAVYFEHWALDALCKAVSEDEVARLDAPVSLFPFLRVEGVSLVVPFSEPVELGPARAHAMRLADGTRSAREIAEACVAKFPDELASVDEVLETFRMAEGMGALTWRFHAGYAQRAELEVRRAFEGIREADARAKALGALDRLERARASVAAAAGDAEGVRRGLEALGAVFTEVTGQRAHRGEGGYYVARNVAYEDCVRGGEVSFGRGLVEKLEVFGPVLASARWMTAQIAARFRVAMLALFDELSPQGTALPMIDLQAAFMERPQFFDQTRKPGMTNTGPGLVLDVKREHVAKWRGILGLEAQPEGTRVVRLRGIEVRAAVAREFPAEGPGWSSARYVSPDVFVAHVPGGEPSAATLVLGEVHLDNTLTQQLFVGQHDEPALLAARSGAEVGERVLLAPTPETVLVRGHRADPEADNLSFEFREVAPRWPGRSLRIADLVVERQGDTLEVVHRDDGRRWDVIELLGDFLTMETVGHYALVAKSGHVPRVMLDDAVMIRERWTFDAHTLDFAGERDVAERFLAVAALREAHGIPVRCFVVSSVEPKPVFVDLGSHPFVDSFCKLVRTAQGTPGATLTLVEMLPDLGALWLEDAQGERYTSELRLTFFDERPPVAPRRRARSGQAASTSHAAPGTLLLEQPAQPEVLGGVLGGSRAR